MLSFNQITRLLKQSPPFVYVDKVLEIEKDKRIVALKNITGTESFTAVHFPHNAIYPGVFIIEASAQAAAVLFAYSQEGKADEFVYVLGGVQRFQFLTPARPGDTLMINVEIIKTVQQMALTKISVTSDGVVVAEGQMSFGVVKDE